MGALPTPDPTAIRYASYIEELREFFSTYGQHYGDPEDLFTVARRLAEPGPFTGDLSLVLRSIDFHEGQSMTRSVRRSMPGTEMLAVAIAGPEMEHAGEEFQQPLSQLFAFIGSVRSRPVSVAPGGRGQLIPFPQTAPVGDSPEPDSLTASAWMRVLLIAAAGAILLATLLVCVFHPSHVQPQEQQPVRGRGATLSSGTHPAKPSPYGEAFLPTHSPVPRHRQAAQAVATSGMQSSTAAASRGVPAVQSRSVPSVPSIPPNDPPQTATGPPPDNSAMPEQP